VGDILIDTPALSIQPTKKGHPSQMAFKN